MTTKEPPSRSEEEIFARLGVRLVLGGVEKPIRELPALANEEWKGKLAAAVAKRVGRIGTLNEPAAIAALFAGVQDVQVELICAYDVDGRLGGADWILEHATATEIWTAFKQVVVIAFPFLADAGRYPAVVGLLLPQLVELLSKPPSPSGDGTSET